MFMRHDTTGEIAMRREFPSLVRILATSRRTTGLKLNRSITRKIASACNGLRTTVCDRTPTNRCASHIRILQP